MAEHSEDGCGVGGSPALPGGCMARTIPRELRGVTITTALCTLCHRRLAGTARRVLGKNDTEGIERCYDNHRTVRAVPPAARRHRPTRCVVVTNRGN